MDASLFHHVYFAMFFSIPWAIPDLSPTPTCVLSFVGLSKNIDGAALDIITKPEQNATRCEACTWFFLTYTSHVMDIFKTKVLYLLTSDFL